MEDVQTRLKEATEKVYVPPWPQEATAASQRASALQARRFGKALRLLRTIAEFDGTLACAVLVPLALERLLEPQIMAFLRRAVGSPALVLERVERVVAVLPKTWFPAGGPVPRGAEPLVELLADVGRGLQAGQAGKDDDVRVLGRETVNLLSRLGAAERSARLAKALKL